MRMVVILAALLASGGTAHAQTTYAPVDRPGPPLSVPAQELAESLSCTGDLAAGDRLPVLLVHGTNLDPKANFGWNWVRALDAKGRPHCEVALEGRGMEDVQDSGERLVHAIRTMHARAKRKIDVVGFSQGGMVPRWALRFWPDTRAMVNDLVGLAASNHGTYNSEYCATSPGCPPSYRQQQRSSRFIAALNSIRETFPGIDYSAVYTRFDQVVTPNQDDTGSTSLRSDGGAAVTNVALQDACPLNTADHLAIGSYDAVAYALAMDALDHPGPVDLTRIDPAVCAQPAQPGVDRSRFAQDYAEYLRVIGDASARSPQVPAEPPLRCYVTASCPGSAPLTPADGGGMSLRLTRRCVGGRRIRLEVTGGAIRGVEWRAGSRRLAVDRTAPFRRTVRQRRARARRLRAIVTTASGRTVLTRTLPRCG